MAIPLATTTISVTRVILPGQEGNPIDGGTAMSAGPGSPVDGGSSSPGTGMVVDGGGAVDYADPDDGYDSNLPGPTVIATGVRATIGMPSANVALSGGDRVAYTATMVTDPADVVADDVVTDRAGTTWLVLWARPAPGFIPHVQGQVRMVTGAS